MVPSLVRDLSAHRDLLAHDRRIYNWETPLCRGVNSTQCHLRMKHEQRSDTKRSAPIGSTAGFVVKKLAAPTHDEAWPRKIACQCSRRGKVAILPKDEKDVRAMNWAQRIKGHYDSFWGRIGECDHAT